MLRQLKIYIDKLSSIRVQLLTYLENTALVIYLKSILYARISYILPIVILVILCMCYYDNKLIFYQAVVYFFLHTFINYRLSQNLSSIKNIKEDEHMYHLLIFFVYVNSFILITFFFLWLRTHVCYVSENPWIYLSYLDIDRYKYIFLIWVFILSRTAMQLIIPKEYIQHRFLKKFSYLLHRKIIILNYWTFLEKMLWIFLAIQFVSSIRRLMGGFGYFEELWWNLGIPYISAIMLIILLLLLVQMLICGFILIRRYHYRRIKLYPGVEMLIEKKNVRKL